MTRVRSSRATVFAALLVLAGCATPEGQSDESTAEEALPGPLARARRAAAGGDLERARRFVARARAEGASPSRLRSVRSEIERRCADRAERTENYRRAHGCLTTLARLIGDSERRADVLVRAARIGERAGRPPARLARLVERSLEASPNGPGRHRLAGRLWHRAGRLDPAIRHYRSAWRANLGDVELGRQLAALLRERGDRRDAIEIYRRLYRQNPEHPQIGLNLAKLEAASGRAARAEGVYLQLLEHHPEHPSILLRYARFLQRQGRTDRAEEIEHRAREKMPGVDRREMRRLE